MTIALFDVGNLTIHPLQQLVSRIRQANCSTLPIDSLANHFLDPPGRVGREFVATVRIIFLDRLQQPNTAFLDQIAKRKTG